MKKRCPWCGELLTHHNYHMERGGVIRCNSCGKWSINYSIIMEIIILLPFAIILVLFMLLEVPIPITIAIFSIFIGLSDRYDTMPLKRIVYEIPEWKLQLEETSFGEFNIKWNEKKSKVFGPWSNAILFLCAINQYNVPVTNMYCVRVIKKRGKYKITQIDERIDHAQIESLFHLKNIIINLYDEKKLVGELLLDSTQ